MNGAAREAGRGPEPPAAAEEPPTLTYPQVSQAPLESPYAGHARRPPVRSSSSGSGSHGHGAPPTTATTTTWKCSCCFVENPLDAHSCGMCTQVRATPSLPPSLLLAAPSAAGASPSSISTAAPAGMPPPASPPPSQPSAPPPASGFSFGAKTVV